MAARKRQSAALFLALGVGGVGGCGVVYNVQEFRQSALTYGYKGDFKANIEVVSLTFESARIANSDGYTPRPLPAALSEQQTNGVDEVISTKDRLAAAGLDQVSPAQTFEVPRGNEPYEASRLVLQPGLRNDGNQPIPVTNLSLGALGGANNLPEATIQGDRTIVDPLDPLTLRRTVVENPLPDLEPPIYRIGPGDIIGLQSRARVLPSVSLAAEETDGGGIGGPQRLLVQDNGHIFIPEVGSVRVADLTLTEARIEISNRLLQNQIGFDTGVEILEFGSKKIGVSGLTGSQVIPVTVRPTTLGEVLALAGGLGSNPENQIVRVLRDGVIYEMQGEAAASRYAGRSLFSGDSVFVAPAYDIDLALKYFDQQLRLTQLDRSNVSDEREKLRLQIAVENYKLESTRLRQQAEIDRLTSQRATDRLNEDARIANIRARQDYLLRLRELEQINRDAISRLRAEVRQVLTANQTERGRERSERFQILQLELAEERQRLQQRAAERQEARAIFSQKLTLGAVERDYVTVAGETRTQTTVPLPFGSRLTLNRVLYEEPKGINTLTGDPSEIYVFRVAKNYPTNDKRDAEDSLIAYHLDATNPASLTAASLFEMRPNDVVYVNPQPIVKWNRVLTQILPSTGLLQTGVNAAGL